MVVVHSDVLVNADRTMLVIWFLVASISKGDCVLVPFKILAKEKEMVKTEEKDKEDHVAVLFILAGRGTKHVH